MWWRDILLTQSCNILIIQSCDLHGENANRRQAVQQDYHQVARTVLSHHRVNMSHHHAKCHEHYAAIDACNHWWYVCIHIHIHFSVLQRRYMSKTRETGIFVCVCVCVCVCCVCRSVYVNAYATSSYHHLDESKRQKLLCALRLRLHEIKASCTPRWCDRAHMRGEEKSPRRVDVQNAMNTHAYICMCTCICFHTKFTEIGTIRRSRYDPTRELIGS